MQRISIYLFFMLLTASNYVFAGQETYFNTLAYGCDQKQQPSSAPYLTYYSSHLLKYAVDIDFVVKQTGICTSLFLALIEQESGLVRNNTTRRKPWIKPFGDLSKKLGFVAQLVDVATKLRELKNRSYTAYFPSNEKMAYLFDVRIGTAAPNRFVRNEKLDAFRILYRDMFMLEYVPLLYLHSSDFGLRQDLLLRGWQFRQNLV